MSDWNTSSSRKNPLEQFLQDPKKLTITLVGLGVVLVTAWALSFSERPAERESPAVAFSAPAPSEALPRPGSGLLAAKPAAAKADHEADALRALQAEAVKDAASPAEEAEAGEEEADDEVPYEAADETGAPGGPVTEAGSLGAFQGFGSGGSSAASAFAGGAGAAGGPGAGGGSGAWGGPGAAGGTGAERARAAAGQARSVSGGGRTARAGAAGTSGAGAGVGSGAGNRFAPAGASGSTFGAAGGSSIGSTGAGGPGYAGGGAGMGGAVGGGGITDEQGGGGPDKNPPGGGGDNDDDGPGGDGNNVNALKRKEVRQRAADMRKTGELYRKAVVAKIMAEERADVQALSQRSAQAAAALKAADAKLAKAAGTFAAFPEVEQNLAETRVGLAEQVTRLRQGSTDLKAALKTMTKVPPQCGGKGGKKAAERTTVGEDGFTDDPAGALDAHRAAYAALKRIAVARIFGDELSKVFKDDAAKDEATLRAADPKLADKYVKLSAAVQKGLADSGKRIPPSLYPTKKKGKKAKKQTAKKFKAIQKDAESGAGELDRRHSELKAVHKAMPQTADLPVAEDAAWRSREASAVAAGGDGQGSFLAQAETFLPPLVKAGEYAAEAYLESCDAAAAMDRLVKDAPK